MIFSANKTKIFYGLLKEPEINIPLDDEMEEAAPGDESKPSRVSLDYLFFVGQFVINPKFCWVVKLMTSLQKRTSYTKYSHSRLGMTKQKITPPQQHKLRHNSQYHSTVGARGVLRQTPDNNG